MPPDPRVQLQPVKHPLHKSPHNKTFSLDRIYSQQWNNFSSQVTCTNRPYARMWRKWNNRDGNWLVSCYGTLWCQLADTVLPGAGCTSAAGCHVCLPTNPASHGTNPSRWPRCSTKSNISTAHKQATWLQRNALVLFCPCLMNGYNLLVPTNAHIILMYITLSGCYMFRLVAIFRKLTTKQL